MRDRVGQGGGVVTWIAALLLVAAGAALGVGGGWVAWHDDGDEPPAAANTSPTADASQTPSAAEAREREYALVRQLGGGMTYDRFHDLLGTPLFTTVSRDGQFTQHLFRRPGYWVQTISDNSGSVVVFAVTSCDPEFNPTFGNDPRSSPSISVSLNQTHLGYTGAQPSKINYFTSGATANSRYIDEYYFGNPGDYKTFWVGINDACPFDVGGADVVNLTRRGDFDPADAAVSAFRIAATANTYAESAPLVDPAAATAQFQIGADRILTRTAPPE